MALYWIYNTCRFAGLSVFVGLLAWGALTLFLALNWGLIWILGRKFADGKSAWRPWAWAALWTAVTFASERWTPRLCVDILGYTQWRYLALIQISSFAGPHFLGFLIVAANAVLERAWVESDAEKGSSETARNFALVLALVVASWAYGVFEMTRRHLNPPGFTNRVEILQPAVDQYQKWDARFVQSIRDNFEELLSRPRSKTPALVVWPESSLPYLVEPERGIPEVAAWAKRLGAVHVVGAVSRENGSTYNAAFLVTPSSRDIVGYHKRELVPFGEFVPFKFLGRFIGILNEMGGISAGAAAQPLFQTPWGPAAASICYEAMFPRWVRADAARGARIVFNLTNDGWYSTQDTWGPYQHFQANVFRAVEDRVTIVRCANNGISGVIDPWGVVTAKLDLHERGRLEAAVPTADHFPQRSFYVRHGDWFGTMCLVVLLVLMVSA